VAVDDVVGVVDGGCASVAAGDMAVVTGLISGVLGAGVSLQACEAASQVLGGSVDVPASFSRRGHSSLDAVCVTASAIVVIVVWVLELVVTLAVSLCFVSQVSRSAVLPRSSPSFSPFSYPSFTSAIFPFSSDLEIASLTTEYASSRPRATMAS
jgi:hypothetical protein